MTHGLFVWNHIWYLRVLFILKLMSASLGNWHDLFIIHSALLKHLLPISPNYKKLQNNITVFFLLHTWQLFLFYTFLFLWRVQSKPTRYICASLSPFLLKNAVCALSRVRKKPCAQKAVCALSLCALSHVRKRPRTRVNIWVGKKNISSNKMNV